MVEIIRHNYTTGHSKAAYSLGQIWGYTHSLTYGSAPIHLSPW